MRISLAVLVVLLVPGCFVDRNALVPTDPVVDRDAQVASDGHVAPTDAPAGTDADGDGIEVEEDCDDGDASVGRIASRECSTPCGTGTESCDAGAWGACSAPTTCACTEGMTETFPCGRCGTQVSRCEDNAWVPQGSCMGEGECMAGTTATEDRSCAACGMETFSRTCSDACVWGGWTGSGVCSGGGVCTAGASEERSQPCGNCGTVTQRRTCTGACGWGEWMDVSACTGQGVCTPGSSTVTESCGTCGDGTRSITTVCNASCALQPPTAGACMGEAPRCRNGPSSDAPRTICECETRWWSSENHICCDGNWIDGTSCTGCP